MSETVHIHGAELSILKGDIIKVNAGIIVNAANTSLLGGGGVDGVIHRTGGPEILEACRTIRQRQGGCAVGEAVITTAGRLPASYVVHTVGPVWNGGNRGEVEKLGSCYIASLRLALKHNIRSIAFPNISTGIYRFPKPLAAEMALASVSSFLTALPAEEQPLDHIYFVCFDEENASLYRERLLDYGKTWN